VLCGFWFGQAESPVSLCYHDVVFRVQSKKKKGGCFIAVSTSERAQSPSMGLVIMAEAKDTDIERKRKEKKQ